MERKGNKRKWKINGWPWEVEKEVCLVILYIKSHLKKNRWENGMDELDNLEINLYILFFIFFKVLSLITIQKIYLNQFCIFKQMNRFF